MRKTFFYLSLLIIVNITVFTAEAADIYVSTKGKDGSSGTREKPLASLHAALRKAREWRRLNDPAIHGGIRIFIFPGHYQLAEPILIHPEDSGTKDSPTQIIALNNGNVVFSGGVRVYNWKKLEGSLAGLPSKASGKVWVADVPTIGDQQLTFRQMWVNGNKAVRAQEKNENQLGRILAWDFNKQTCQIPFSKNINYGRLKGAELMIHQWWAIANLRIDKAIVKGNAVEISFLQPESRIQSEHPWPSPWLSAETGNSAFNLLNSIQFLDEPGEWYEDLVQHKIYYWPRAGEQPNQVEVLVPNLETLLKIGGTIDNPVTYIDFKGISFSHSSWLRPSKLGHVPLQAGMYLLDAYKLETPGTPDKSLLENQAWVGRPSAAVSVKYAKSINFEGCVFEHLSSTGLDYERGTQNSLIKGNLFRDIGGSGILIGEFSNENTEAHLPYQPLDEREIATDIKIENNLVTAVTDEDWGAVGIGAGYVREIKIMHNDINEVSYTGISLGWGWTSTINAMKNNVVSKNKIHHYGKRMYDVAGIYTLSAQPGSIIEENVVDSIYQAKYAHLPDHWFYIYTDEGTAGVTIKQNWTPAQKYLQNANGPGNVWRDNGNQVSQTIKGNAGLEKPYQYLLKYRARPQAAQPINLANQKIVFELIFPTENEIPIQKIRDFCKDNQLPPDALYAWKNHVVIYTTTQRAEFFRNQLATQFNVQVKLYDNIFYDFNRQRNCSLTPAKEWDHVILSANLVNDEKLQQEYLTYHAEQFNKWPELSKGFCNAEFQQLVIYRNGRQLMLIISIPKGKSLDELNPKTTQDNPRVDEWNALMKKYQVGIEGTKPGEVWVFFDKIKK
ncbi:MAG: right-handed parallel beta-helix repeat-containing protein [Pedobacter sp.]|nr:right-handed parallel beta-helix repeat-containing protein [Pedobacter sp.]MDQ8051748.1 right-handed parallel beta-helix repeat-containing protein [Pedobacter sp.]